MMIRALSLLILIGLAANASACNIPVFRYALERWRPDAYEIVVFHRELTADQESAIAKLEATSQERGGSVNSAVIRSRVGENQDPSLAVLWNEIATGKDASLPYVVVRANVGQGKAMQPWRGSLEDAERSGLVDSPARRELIRRLQNSHSVVWLMVKSKDDKKNASMREFLKSQCQTLESKIKLPEGIGLPGSELHSEVPLLIKFSFLEIDPDDAKESFLIRLFTGVRSEVDLDAEPFVVPVFGRGRALEVIPAHEVDASLMEDLTLFLSGACSCQVKERNPGFDLLLSTHWDRELFGENGILPPPPRTVNDTDRDRAPTLLSIPPGRKK